MAKNNVVKKQKVELNDDFDFSDAMELQSDEAMAGMMSGIIEASQHQQKMAIELTKLVVENSSIEGVNEDKIFAIFKRSSNIVSENFPLKALWEKFS